MIFALFGKTDDMITALRKMEEMKNAGVNFGLDPITPPPPVEKDCFQVPIPCSLLARYVCSKVLKLRSSKIKVRITIRRDFFAKMVVC